MVALAAFVAVLGRLSAVRLRLLGSVATAAGMVGLVAFVLGDLTAWLRTVPPSWHRYCFQRILFAVGTNPNLPLVPLTAAGVVCWAVGRRRQKRIDSAPGPTRVEGDTTAPCPTTPSSPTA